jgi:hypothetical protein
MCSADKALHKWSSRDALDGWFCDSGAFTHLNKHGTWKRSAPEHVELVRTLQARCAGMEWASPQDWMCEPFVLAKTGLTLQDHQHRTVDNLVELRSLAPEIPWVPVLQGYEVEDYFACWRMYEDAGVDLYEEPLVGIGSVCRRQNSMEIELLFYNFFLADLHNLHGFGVKMRGLDDYKEYLLTADSAAWSRRARWAGEPLCGGTDHKRCSGCFTFAHQWYDKVKERCGLT